MSGRGKKPAAPRKKASGYKMPVPIATGEVIHDSLNKKKWRIGPSIGVGGFGEIYSVCDHESSAKGSNYPFVIKIEPHENGPLFVEKHFYLKNTKKEDIEKFMKDKKLTSLGVPTHFGSGTHDYKGEKYRYLVLERYGKDVWKLFLESGRSFPPATVFQLGLQMLEALEYFHSKGYVHADIKGANILLGLKKGTENQAYLVDFGLASRINDKEFKPNPKCAHNGTIEYTSRDAHIGVSTMRGDLEILGYNMLQWLVGQLPWEKNLSQPKTVQEMKEAFMKNVRTNITKQFKNVPEALIKFFEHINTLKPNDTPDYDKCRKLFENYLKTEGKTRNSKFEFKPKKGKKTENNTSYSEESKITSNGDITKPKRVKKVKEAIVDESENLTPESSSERSGKIVKRKDKRKSTDPTLIVKVKKTKLAPKATPPVKKNHASIATQTSIERPKRSPRQVSFDSPVAAYVGESKLLKSRRDLSANSSGDIFEDSFVIENNKVKPKKRLLSDEDVTVKRVVKKKVTTVQKPKKVRSWKDFPTIVNGRSPPK